MTVAEQINLFDGEIADGSPDWITQAWERMERENPTQTILGESGRILDRMRGSD